MDFSDSKYERETCDRWDSRFIFGERGKFLFTEYENFTETLVLEYSTLNWELKKARKKEGEE